MRLLLDLQAAQTESRFRGIGRQARALAKALIAQGGAHDIHLLFNARLRDGLDELFAELGSLVPAGNITLFEVPDPVAERDRGNLWRTYAAEFLREAAIARLKPDVVHIASLFEGYVDDAVTSIGRLQAPHATAVTLHDLIPLADPARYLSEELPRRHWLRRAQFLKRADLLLSVSEHSRGEAIERLHIDPARIAVVSGGVEAKFRPLVDAGGSAALRARYQLDRPFVFYVGAVDPRKNVELIFAAFAQLPERLRAEHDLAFAGRLFEEEIGTLRVAAARCGIPATQLRFCQHVPEADLIGLYGLCSAFVFPSVHEGFGLPALEAMACGAPTLAARATSLVEVVANDALMFDPTVPDELAAKLERLLTDPEFAESARAWGSARAVALSWDEVGRKALAALEALHAANAPRSARPLARKPLLAFVSPLPPARTGIADYGAELLPELARFYEIECVVAEPAQSDEWIIANFPIRDLSFFERNAHRYDRIVYAFGNSHFHAHMIGLLRNHPGVVLLHDFHLSDLLDWMSGTGVAPYDDFFRELYRTHGLTGLLVERRDGRRAAVRSLPCNEVAFSAATGVIVHSRYSLEQAKALYGEAIADKISVIPHLRALDPAPDRAAARKRLGLEPEDFVLCSFGIVTERKRSRDLFDAWLASAASKRPGSRLVFVGENLAGPYGESLVRAIAAGTGDVRITGYASREQYRDYLAAADLAVQLRTESRGETSGTVLDCLAVGLPTIINAHGPTAEIPDTVVIKLADDFAVEDLTDAIDQVQSSAALRKILAERGRDHIAAAHDPRVVGEAFERAIERAEQLSSGAFDRTLTAALSDFTAPVYPTADDLRAVGRTMASQQARLGLRQLLYDVTVLAESDARTGIQRVVRAVLVNLIENPPAGFRIEPVRMAGHQFRYARRFVAESLDLPSAVLPDAPVEGDAGDIYLSIDWVPDRLPMVETWLSEFRLKGGRVVVGVHDLLPLQLPQYFPDFMPTVTRRWFETALRVADQFVCVSRVVADDVAHFGTALAGNPIAPVAVDFFHNAADINASVPTSGRPADAHRILAALRARPSFLMVGTVEPRKGHVQVVKAFERLWREGSDVALVIVGKKGWMVDSFEDLVRQNPEYERRLFWLQGISDEFLDEVYAASAALIAASAGEGFGLPLIEAALHKVPLIARDIPVFREVAGDHAFYFSGESPSALAESVSRWLNLSAKGKAPKSDGMPIQTWAESTEQLKALLVADTHYCMIAPVGPLPGEGFDADAREA
jgi:glycosyltransferase involved in cell wall biosynthesis